MFRKIIYLILVISFLFQQTGFSQIAGELDLSSHFQRLGGLFTQDTFRPLHLRYLSYDALSKDFNLILDKGDSLKGLSPTSPPTNKWREGADPEADLKEETSKLMQYFFIGLALPNEAFWVNLRPDSPSNIIDDELAKTEIGRIFLEADLQLKKDTANFTSPKTPEGREYWNKLYKKAAELYGNENITIPTLTRPWIVPGEIIIRESKDNAYIYKATLKVMLESDYLRDGSQNKGKVSPGVYEFKDQRSRALNEYSSQLIRELIIPKLTKEVNSSKRYAPLRQVYYSLILAQWFKQKFHQHEGRSLTGLASKEEWDKTTYFNQYKRSFAQGEYNIKEPVYTPTGQVIRSYFSGGVKMLMAPVVLMGSGSPVAGKSYLMPLRVNEKEVVIQPLAASPVLSQQEIENLKKELAFYIMGSHDLRNAGRILHVLSSGIRKGTLNNNEVKVDKIYNLFKIYGKYLEKGELSINEPLKLAEIVKKLRNVNEAITLEFIRLKPFFGKNLQEDIDYILDILSREPKMYYMNLSKELEWIIDWYRAGYHYNIEFNVNASERNIMYILGNKYLLKRIIANLISNTEAARIDKGIQSEDIKIIVKAKDDKYIITYNDNAGGIRPDILPVIFEPRATTKDREKEPLSGYGMAICKELIEKMGGTITVESELGKGTTFTITLPAAADYVSEEKSSLSAHKALTVWQKLYGKRNYWDANGKWGVRALMQHLIEFRLPKEDKPVLILDIGSHMGEASTRLGIKDRSIKVLGIDIGLPGIINKEGDLVTLKGDAENIDQLRLPDNFDQYFDVPTRYQNKNLLSERFKGTFDIIVFSAVLNYVDFEKTLSLSIPLLSGSGFLVILNRPGQDDDRGTYRKLFSQKGVKKQGQIERYLKEYYGATLEQIDVDAELHSGDDVNTLIYLLSMVGAARTELLLFKMRSDASPMDSKNVVATGSSSLGKITSSPAAADPSKPSASPLSLKEQDRIINDFVGSMKILNSHLIQAFEQLESDFTDVQLSKLRDITREIKLSLKNFIESSKGFDRDIRLAIEDVFRARVLTMATPIELGLGQEEMPDLRERIQEYIQEIRNLELIAAADELGNIKYYRGLGHFINVDNLGERIDTKSASPLGGIDMRHLAKNTVIERKGDPSPQASVYQGRLGASSPSNNKELEEIQRLIQAGIIPTTKRLEECRGACSAEALLSCIADILRIEEERVTETEAGLKNLLASL